MKGINRIMKTNKLLVFVFALVSGSESLAQLESGKNVIIRDKVSMIFMLLVKQFQLNAAIQGDLTVAGGTITVTDTIVQDILGAGSNIIFNGYVGDDIRCAAGKIKLSNNVAEMLL
jgi:hypothetical protein